MLGTPSDRRRGRGCRTVCMSKAPVSVPIEKTPLLDSVCAPHTTLLSGERKVVTVFRPGPQGREKLGDRLVTPVFKEIMVHFDHPAFGSRSRSPATSSWSYQQLPSDPVRSWLVCLYRHVEACGHAGFSQRWFSSWTLDCKPSAAFLLHVSPLWAVFSPLLG